VGDRQILRPFSNSALKNYRIAKMYSLEYIEIPKAFFMPHHGR
jgi:hypothetical protein